MHKAYSYIDKVHASLQVIQKHGIQLYFHFVYLQHCGTTATNTTTYLFRWLIQEVKCQWVYLKSKELQYNICQVTPLNFWDGIFQHCIKFLKIYIPYLYVHCIADDLTFFFLFLCNCLSVQFLTQKPSMIGK